ncbi:unnamed protein product [Fusarium graminearum]|uniref:Chromosome 3, complete genome n=2 Tax=Gibberella zeae TaxID=5518 RepID=A0A0E0SQM5_GIBZE|nr:hypothetical protein FG05_30224 [Fusarium graminearum]CAF3462397.1 unnamed protein product [Fusarium graminearum]CAF3535191.1 unnamed protein product [Fusarium graminearum]CAF3580358.1 unnamed protein product [Fusarium graminearum]CAG1963555.1 unnamed protein product [Fusarium graminearum]
MCLEKTKHCPVCSVTDTIEWVYCEPYKKETKTTSRTGKTPPSISFKRESHNPPMKHDITKYYSPFDCPTVDCPSKIKDEGK